MPSSGEPAGGANNAGRPRGKPRGFRRDRDCTTCKQRGVKCDLNRPQCLPCVQSGLSCGGYPRRVVWVGGEKGVVAKKWTRAAASPTPTSSSPSSLAFTSYKPATSITSVPRPESALSVASAPTLASSPASTSVSSSSTSALTISPTSVSTLTPTFTLAPSPASSTPIPAVASPLTATPTPEWSGTDQNSLMKRLAALCSHILATEEDNVDDGTRSSPKLSPETTSLLSDLCLFIQARMESRSELPAVSHNNTTDATPAEPVDMVRHRLAALARLNRAIEAANPLAFLGIATFAVFEVCDTTFGEWKCHLYGARGVLDHHGCRSMADLHRLARLVPGLLDILARLLWFDICGAVVRRGTDDETALIFDDWHRDVLDAAFFRTIGCPPDTCALYVDVARGEMAQDPISSCLRVTEQVLALGGGGAVKDGLGAVYKNSNGNEGQGQGDSQKSCDQRFASPPDLASSTGSESSPWLTSADANRCAAALAVLDQVPGAAASGAASALADRLCALLAATPSSSPYYIHLALAAYVAGMHALTAEHCRVVREYWRNCSLAGISRYPGGLARCEDHWRHVGLLQVDR